jgi:hypothetical protein
MADSAIVLQVSLDRDKIEFTEIASLVIPMGVQLGAGVMLLKGDHILHSYPPVHSLWNFKMNWMCNFSFREASQVRVILTARVGRGLIPKFRGSFSGTSMWC